MQEKPGSALPSAKDAEDLQESHGDDVKMDSGLHTATLLDGSTDPDDQSWFWTDSWQDGEAEAELDKAAGRIIHLTPEDIQERIRAASEAGESQKTQ